MIDELDLAGQEHLDNESIASFDKKQGYPDPSEDLALFREHGIDKRATIIDFGAGTGQFAIPAGRQFAKVIAVDVSPAMVAELRRRGAESGLQNIESVEAGLLTYTHTGRPVDAAYSRNALHHLPDFWKAIALVRIAKTLKPGGLLRLRDLVFDCQPSEIDDLLTRWFGNAASDPSMGYTKEDFIEHVRTEHSTFRWLLEPMLAAAGLDILTAEFERSVYGAYLCKKR